MREPPLRAQAQEVERTGRSVWLGARAADGPDFQVGTADRDITPPTGIPMWGYGARHDQLSDGTLDPLMAKAIQNTDPRCAPMALPPDQAEALRQLAAAMGARPQQ